MSKKILVIDDDVDILEALKISLESEGYETKVTPDGTTAIEQVRAYRPDLILLDIMLSGCDGRDIASCLKKELDLKNIPIVMISAKQMAEQSALDCGASAFLPKPFAMDTLYSTVKAYV